MTLGEVWGENAYEVDPAVTGRVMDLHGKEIFYLVCYLEHLQYIGFCFQIIIFTKSIGA